MMRLSYRYILISGFLALTTSKVDARPSPQEKAAARAAFWGLFADTYLATTCFERKGDVHQCAYGYLRHAVSHSKEVDIAIANSDFSFSDRLDMVNKSLDAHDHALAEKELNKIQAELIDKFAAASAPAVVPDLSRGALKYREHCLPCHGSADGAPGSLEKRLKLRPQPLNAPWRKYSQTPLGIYATLIHGVDGTEMLPLVEVMDIDELWSIAFYVATFSLDPEAPVPGQKFQDLIDKHADSFALVDLARLHDQALIDKLNKLEYSCGECSSELLYLRRKWLPSAPRLGQYEKDERQAKEARGLTILIILITVTSIGFGVILSRRSRFK